MARKKRTTSAEPTALLCPCKQLDEFTEHVHRRGREATVEDAERIAGLRRKVWWCWFCQMHRGCPDCTPRPGLENLDTRGAASTCPRCGLFMSALPFLLQGASPQQFQIYPSGWRLEYFAIHGGPKSLLHAVRVHLRDDKARGRVNQVLRHLGRTEYQLDQVSGQITPPFQPDEHEKG